MVMKRRMGSVARCQVEKIMKDIDENSRVLIMLMLLMMLGIWGSALGCASPAVPDHVLSSGADEFLLGPEDVLTVTVWKNPDLSRDLVVRPDGMISMPLVGDIQASGLVADDLARQIAERLKGFMESPTVSVSVTQVNSYSIFVLGEVRTPGKFPLKSYATVLHAIALAGGFTEFASRNDIQVIRHSPNGDGAPQEIHIPVRYDDLVSGGNGARNFFLQSGDIMVVP